MNDQPHITKRKHSRIFPLYILLLCVGFGGALVSFLIPLILNTPDDQVPTWLVPLIITLLSIGAFGGIILPVLVHIYKGGETVHKYGGLASLLVILGLVVTAAGESVTFLLILGIAMIVLGAILLFYFGKKSGTPIWLQLPILFSPRLYINKGKDPLDKKSRRF